MTCFVASTGRFLQKKRPTSAPARELEEICGEIFRLKRTSVNQAPQRGLERLTLAEWELL